jgi:ESS family glutamate:Na+ symporter
MTDFTPWTLLTDAGLIGLLLVIGTVLRARVGFLQRLMIPASFIAGILGLVFGPSLLGWLPFSDQLGTYSSVLIVVVFACLAMSDDFNILKVKGPVVGFSAYSVLMYAIQVALGMAVVLVCVGPLLGVGDEFGVLIFAGWAGGFGSAAAVGQVFSDAGQPEMQSLAFMSATVGLLAGIVGGLAQAKFGAARGHAKEFSGMHRIPKSMRTGVLDHDDEPEAVGHHKFSGASIESLGFQVSVIVAVSAAGYGVSELLGGWFPDIAFPVFSIAFVVGLVARGLFRATRTTRYIDRRSLNSISGTATDILIVCGIASIKLDMVSENWVAMVVLFLIALVICLFLGLIVAPRTLQDGWFEKQIFTWGWATGGVNTAIALLRVIDPKLRSGTMEDFALAYIPVVPVEVTAVTFVPSMVLAGAAWAVVGIWGAVSVAAVVVLLVVVRGARSAGRTPTAAS